MNKKGQAQDVFADLLPALVIILLICLPTLAVMNYSHKTIIVSNIVSVPSEFLATDALISLKMPVPGIETDMGTLYMMIDSSEDMQWAVDAELLTSDNECGDTMKLLLGKHFEGYGDWSLTVSNPSGEIFTCSSTEFNPKTQASVLLPTIGVDYDLTVTVGVSQ